MYNYMQFRMDKMGENVNVSNIEQYYHCTFKKSVYFLSFFFF